MLTYATSGTTQTLSVSDRSLPIYVPALSTVSIYISSSASVKVISNPFNASAKDKVLSTITSSNDVAISTATILIIDATLTSGTVDITITPNGRPFVV